MSSSGTRKPRPCKQQRRNGKKRAEARTTSGLHIFNLLRLRRFLKERAIFRTRGVASLDQRGRVSRSPQRRWRDCPGASFGRRRVADSNPSTAGFEMASAERRGASRTEIAGGIVSDTPKNSPHVKALLQRPVLKKNSGGWSFRGVMIPVGWRHFSDSPMPFQQA
jgi:hypothetical protein